MIIRGRGLVDDVHTRLEVGEFRTEIRERIQAGNRQGWAS